MNEVLKKIGDGIVNFAPTLGGLLMATGVGAPVGMALNAVSALGRAFGLGDNPTPEAVATAMLSDPDARLKIMAAENAFTLSMRDADIKTLQAQLADIQNARARQTEHEKVTTKSDINLYVLSWTIIVGFFALTGALLYFSYSGKSIVDNTGVLFTLLGTLASGVIMVLTYFYGSNKSSDSKTAMIYNSTANVPKVDINK